MKNLVLTFGAIMIFVSTALAQTVPVLDMFHGAECPHCHKQIKWLPTLEAMYPDIQINKYEVWHDDDNKKLAIDRLAALGEEFSGVPTNIIGDKVIIGFQPEAIVEMLTEKYGPPVEGVEWVEPLKEDDGKKKVIFFGIIGFLVVVSGFIFHRKS